MNDEGLLKIWNIYQSAWGPVDAQERRRLLAASVADDCVYTDPGSQAHGVEALATRIAESQAKFPNAHFRNDAFLEHHRQGLFHWTMYDGAGAVFVTGSSFACFGDDDRLMRMTGFFGAAPTVG